MVVFWSLCACLQGTSERSSGILLTPNNGRSLEGGGRSICIWPPSPPPSTAMQTPPCLILSRLLQSEGLYLSIYYACGDTAQVGGGGFRDSYSSFHFNVRCGTCSTIGVIMPGMNISASQLCHHEMSLFSVKSSLCVFFRCLSLFCGCFFSRK